MIYALDSNILLRSIEENHPQQDEALAAINKLISRGVEVFLIPQILYEFWAVATRPKKDRGLEIGATQIELFLTKFESAFPLKHDNQLVYKEWRHLVTQHAVLGKPSHDSRIAAALIAHGITHFVTFNKEHFDRFKSFNCLLPSEI